MRPKGPEFHHAKGVGSFAENPIDRVVPARLTPFGRVERVDALGLGKMLNYLIGSGVDEIVPGRILYSNK